MNRMVAAPLRVVVMILKMFIQKIPVLHVILMLILQSGQKVMVSTISIAIFLQGEISLAFYNTKYCSLW